MPTKEQEAKPKVIETNETFFWFKISAPSVSGRVGYSTTPDKGVPDMTSIPDIDETGINRNLNVRYVRDEIYVSFTKIELHFSSSSFLCVWFAY